MANLLWGYLGVGYIVALIFALFFTKIMFVKLLSDKCEFEINTDKSCIFIPLLWAHIIIVLANTDDEILFDGLKIAFQLGLGWLFLISGLIWPISLIILAVDIYAKVFGQSSGTIES